MSKVYEDCEDRMKAFKEFLDAFNKAIKLSKDLSDGNDEYMVLHKFLVAWNKDNF